MSIFQTLIGSAVGASAPPLYPVPGFGYPNAGGSINATGVIDTISGYYEASSLSNPVVGLWRRTYSGEAVGSGTFDPAFPTGYSEQQSMLDPYVGFGNGTDVATEYTMEWKGYFKPAVTGDFVFSSTVDDYMFMWLGQTATTGYDVTNYVLRNSMGSNRKTMTAGKYYPVLIRFSEHQGGNECSISFALNGEQLQNNQQNASIGQFYTDDVTNSGFFPGTGLIV